MVVRIEVVIGMEMKMKMKMKRGRTSFGSGIPREKDPRLD
jgi:hypothetical protein